jgi:hypothetical protein
MLQVINDAPAEKTENKDLDHIEERAKRLPEEQ